MYEYFPDQLLVSIQVLWLYLQPLALRCRRIPLIAFWWVQIANKFLSITDI